MIKKREQIECNDTLANNLVLLIKQRNLTNKEICKEIGVSEATLSAITRGVRNPSLDIVYKIATYFNVSIDELVGFNGNNIEIDKIQLKRDLVVFLKIKKYLDDFYKNISTEVGIENND